MSGTQWTPETLAKVIEAFVTVIGILLALCTAILAVANTVKVLRGLKKPQDDLKARVSDHDTCIAKVNDRLQDGNERFEHQDRMIDSLQNGQRVMCLGLQALINRAVYGNNEASIKDAQNQLNKYLTDAIAGSK